MSGVQKIAIVLSVLWIASAPFLITAVVNQDASRSYADCISEERAFAEALRQVGQQNEALLRDRLAEILRRPRQRKNAPVTDQQPQDRCLNFASLRRIGIGTFFNVTTEAATDWTLALVPLLVVWLVGGIILATARRIRRWFSADDRSQGRGVPDELGP